MAKFCRYCGYPIGENARFCQNCGAKVNIGNNQKNDFAGPAQSQKPARPVQPQNYTRPIQPQNLSRSMQPQNPKRPVQPQNSTRQMQPQNSAGLVQPQVRHKPAKSPALHMICIGLSILLVVEAVIACFWYPGLLRDKFRKPSGEVIETTAVPETGGNVLEYNTDPNVKKILDYLCISGEDLAKLSESEITPTPENSPGNPAFIDVSFTEEERNNAVTLSAPVSLENPEADFPEFGIHADLKWWNLENEEDTLIIKRLPVKSCSVTGSTLYTYDISLASGQKEFQTEVEITFPVQGEALAFEGTVHKNDETGKWEEDYYTLSEYGNFYTARMTHFSDEAQLLSDAVTRQMQQEGKKALDFYKSDGKSIFRIMPKEDNSKYNGVNTYLYGVGLVKIPDYETYLKTEDAYAVNVLRGLFEKSGDVPAEAGEAVALASMGTKGDTVSTLQNAIAATVLNENNTTQELHDINVYGGVYLTYYGLSTLGMRLLDQLDRGVSWINILKSNSWNVLNSLASIIGSAASIAGAASYANGAAIVCGAIYAYTRFSEYKEAKYKAERPLGYPATLEEGAFYYYVADYNDGTEDAIQHVLQKVMKEIPVPDGRNHALGYDTEINFRGTGWPEAFAFILEHYKENPEAMANAVKMMYSEYEKYIDRFFDGMNKQSGDASALREECWKAFCSKALSPQNAARIRNLENKDILLNLQVFAGENEISERQAWRWKSIVEWADQQKTRDNKWEDVWNKNNSDEINFDRYSSHYNFRNINTFGDLIEFDTIGEKDMDAMKKHAKETLYANTNPVIYAFYKRYYDDAIKEIREALLGKVLPWFNTQVTFYIEDKTLGPNQKRSDTRFNTFYLTDAYNAFNPKMGKEYVTDLITLKKKEGKPILLVTNIYHYIRCGCPTNVEIFIQNGNRYSESLNCKIDWTGIEVREDPAALYNAMSFEAEEVLSVEASTKTIQDIKVPVIYGDSIAKLEGKWKPTDDSSEYANKYIKKISLSVGPYGQNCSYSISSAIDNPGNFSTSDSDFSYIEGPNGKIFNAIKKDGSDAVTYTIKHITDDVIWIKELDFYLERIIEYDPAQDPDLVKFFGYWEQVGGTGNIISIARGGKKELLAYGERYIENDGKKNNTFDNGFAVDDWYYDRQKRELTLTSSGFLRGMIECTLIDDDYIEIKNGQGDINRYIRTDNGYDVSKLTETYKGSPSGKTTMGVGTTVNTLTFGGSDKKETKESK